MKLRFSKKMAMIMKKCEERTRALNRFTIEPEDVLLSIMYEDYLKVIDYITSSIEPFSKDALSLIKENLKKIVIQNDNDNMPIIIFDITESSNTKKLFYEAQKFANENHSKYIEPEHIVYVALAVIRDEKIINIFMNAGFSIKKFVSLITKNKNEYNIFQHNNEEIRFDESETPVADYLCKDLTELARNGEIDPAINRDAEIERLIQILGRRKKNNPVLIGKPGVGKTAIVEAIADRIVNGEVPKVLQNKRLLSLDMGMMVAGTKYRGQFEERMKNFIKELESNDNILLFIDELHNIVGTGSAEGSMDAANMLKPQLSRGTIQTIGATTLKEYRKYIEKDGALERRFQPIYIKELDEEKTIDILMKIKHKYEDFHNVKYTDDAIVNAVKLSQIYITDRVLPDKAIDIIDEAGSKMAMGQSLKLNKRLSKLKKALEKTRKEKQYYASIGKYEKAGQRRNVELELEKKIKNTKNSNSKPVLIDTDIIKEVISLWTNIPIDRLSIEGKSDIGKIEEKLRECIIGQDHVIDVVSKSIKLSLLGLKQNNKPQMTFLFIGPTGVGKTYLAKKMAEFIYNDKESFLRFDMSEYSLEHEIDKLIGSPPGFIGYEDGGKLTEFARRHPYSLLLFDEIEKAHPNVYNLFLQILEEGELTDSFHRKINLKNMIIIFTSNVGTFAPGEYKNIGFAKDNLQYDEKAKKRFLEETKKRFRPEFLNRLDNIIVFNPLTFENIEEIFKINLNELIERYKNKGYIIEISHDVISYLAKKEYNPEYGARAVLRSIEKDIESLVSEALINNNFNKEMKMLIFIKNRKIQIQYIENKNTIKSQEEI